MWNAARTIRKALVVATYEEFQRKGREKVGLSPSEPVRVVLEGDGTQVKFFTSIKMKSNDQMRNKLIKSVIPCI